MNTGDNTLRMNAIARLVSRLGTITRLTKDTKGNPETDTTHSMMLALVARSIAILETKENETPFDLHRIMMYALVHDLPEAFAGGVPMLRKPTVEIRVAKDLREQDATDCIAENTPEIASWIRRYNKQTDLEAKLVHSVDKMLPKITHTWDDCAMPKESGFALDEVIALCDEQAECIPKDLTVTQAISRTITGVLAERWDSDGVMAPSVVEMAADKGYTIRCNETDGIYLFIDRDGNYDVGCKHNRLREVVDMLVDQS